MLTKYRNNAFLTKKLYDRSMEPLCGLYHVTRMELDILLFLANNPQYDTAADIVEKRGFTKSHVSSSLKLLEEKGCLEKTFHEGNRKTVHLRLLPASDEIVSAGQEVQEEIFARIFAGLSPEEIDAMDKIFNKMSANIIKSLQEA